MNLRRARDKQSLHTSSLITQIKQQFIKRQGISTQEDLPSPNTIKFYLNYEELSLKKQSEGQQNNSEMRIRKISFPKMGGEDKRKPFAEDIAQPKKVSVNFDCFHPRKKSKGECSQKKVHPFEEVWNLQKEKYIERIQKQNRRRSEKSRIGHAFGLNIKTITKQPKQVRSLPSRPARPPPQKMSPQPEKGTPMFQSRPQKIHTYTQLPLSKTTTSNDNKIVAFHNKKEVKQKSTIKNRIIQMISSANDILRSYHCSIQKNTEDRRFKYFVGKGNNRSLIVSLLKKRWWWTETTDIKEAHFVWTQLKHKASIKRQTDMVQFSKEDLEESQNTKNSDSSPQAVQDSSSQVAIFQLKKLITSMKKNKNVPCFPQPQCLHNHFEHNYMLGNKNALFQNLSSYFTFQGQDVYTMIPLTFFVTSPHSKQFQNFAERAKQMKNAIWIVKPGENSNRGHGIFVSKSVEEISHRLSRRKSKKSYIIQRYITNLLLYQRRKFDIRTYLLMLTMGGVTKFYWYNQGYLRTSSQIFDLKDLSDFFIHLTNDAIQINNDNYGKYEDGNKITYSQFQRYLDLSYPQQKYNMKQIDNKMRQIATTTVKATYNKIDLHRKAFGFELFGFDFVVDSDLKPWLIEVNTNPCIELGSPILARLVPRMLENIFRMAVDPIFQANTESSKNTSYYIYQKCMDTNRFTLIFDSLTDRNSRWQQFVQSERNKEYQDENVVFEGDGDDTRIDD